MKHVMCHFLVEEVRGEMKLNELGRHTVERQNSWHQVNHSKLYSDLWALKRGPVIALDSQQGELNFCIHGTHWRADMWRKKIVVNFEGLSLIHI